MQIIALALATFIPIIVLFVIRSLDLYQTGEFRSILLCFAWGLVAYGLAFFTNTALMKTGIFTSWNDIVRYVAPVAEEILKSLVLFYLVRRPKFTYFVDGAIYGFAIGIGFAVIENFQYILQSPNAGFGTAIGRVISVNLIHACATALVGVALGLSRFERGLRRWAVALSGLVAAILLHGVFNNLVSRLQGGLILLYSTIIALAAVALITVIIFRGLAEQRAWIEEKLGAADRVTASEARVVHRLEDLQEVLKPLRDTFGAEKGDQIEQFLLIQARLGILRKTLDKLPDEKMRHAVEKQMGDLRTEMDVARRKVGSYAMLYVRNIFPEEASPLWGLLETRIQERIAARPASGGANLFASLGQRMPSRGSGQPVAEPGAEPGQDSSP
jgi:RsiW-degrading membrane proteinase PrsW (M82 family)